MFSRCQAADGWAAEPTGDWGTEESWESVDGSQGESISLTPLSGAWLFLIVQNELKTDVTLTFYKFTFLFFGSMRSLLCHTTLLEHFKSSDAKFSPGLFFVCLLLFKYSH